MINGQTRKTFCNAPLRRISKQIRKHDCMISHTDSLVKWAPTGVSSRVLRTWNTGGGAFRFRLAEYLVGIVEVCKNCTCNIFIRTTSSLAGSVPTNLACVTASAMFSMASAAASWLESVQRKTPVSPSGNQRSHYS